MSDLQQRIKQILARNEHVQVGNTVQGGYDVEYAMPKHTSRTGGRMVDRRLMGMGRMDSDDCPRCASCPMCKTMRGGLMEYDNPREQGSGISEMMNYAVANDALSGNGKMKMMKMMKPVKPRKVNTKGIEALRRFQEKVSQLKQRGFTHKQAVELLRRFKNEGDGFFDDVLSGIESVGEAVAPYAPLIALAL